VTRGLRKKKRRKKEIDQTEGRRGGGKDIHRKRRLHYRDSLKVKVGISWKKVKKSVGKVFEEKTKWGTSGNKEGQEREDDP